MAWTIMLRRHVLRDGDQLLQRIQWLFVLLNCLLAVLAPLDLMEATAPTGVRASALLVGSTLLGAWSVFYFRRGRPGFVLDAIPLVLLFVIGLAAGAPEWVFARMYIAVFFVALYRPGRLRHLTLSVAYLAMYEAVAFLTGGGVSLTSILSEGVSIVVVAGIMQTLARAVHRHERFARRDALLTEVVRGLLGERNADRMNAMVADAVLQLVDVPGALVTVWRSEGTVLRRVGLGGRESYPLVEADLTGLSQEFRDIYEGGRAASLDAGQLNAIHAYYGINDPHVAAVVAPMLRDGAPSGLLVVGSPEPLDDDLVQVLERFAHEVALAQQLTERETMLQGLVENSSDVIAVVDEQGVFTYVSPAITATTGHDPVDVIGRPVDALLRAGDEQQAGLAIGFPTRTPIPLAIESTGGRIDVEVTANPLPDGTTILNIRDISDRRRLEAEIEYRAFHDDVTGLANRALLLDRLAYAVRRRERDGGLLAVALLDIDDFKGVNDTLGHAAGDVLLQRVAGRLVGSIRDVDTASRLGGDEFALVLEGFSDEGDVSEVVERILASIREPVTLEGRDVIVSASVGVTIIDRATAVDELLRNADAAMYVAKRSGKNRVAVFHPTMNQHDSSRLELRSELETAIRTRAFEVHYQPCVTTEHGDVTGFEALVRWRHPVRGLVPPNDFIPLAEETGLIAEIGRWVLDEACDQVSRWVSETGEPIAMAVNLSAVQLRNHDVVADVATALKRSGIPPCSLTLEVTETALIGDAEVVGGVLRGLKDLGVRLAIDDFGTGYSSFTHLQTLPFDVIKVDRSFVSVVDNGPEHAAYAKAIVAVAQTLGLETIAEGVETIAALQLLRTWGCSLAQGWLWHPALPADEAGQLLVRRVLAATNRA